MSARLRKTTHRHVTVWLPNEQVTAMDSYIAREVARVPGARVSRHSWLAALVARELAAVGAQPAEAVRS